MYCLAHSAQLRCSDLIPSPQPFDTSLIAQRGLSRKLESSFSRLQINDDFAKWVEEMLKVHFSKSCKRINIKKVLLVAKTKRGR